MIASTAPSRLLRTEEVARWLDISPRTIRLWAECSELQAVKVGRQWRFKKEDVLRWLNDNNPGAMIVPTQCSARKAGNNL